MIAPYRVLVTGSRANRRTCARLVWDNQQDRAVFPHYAAPDPLARSHRGGDSHAGYPLPQPEEPAEATAEAGLYEPKPGTPRAILVDIDGTVALKGTRSPFDETRVHEDQPNEPVITVIRALAATHRIVFLSGRTDGCRDATYEWLIEHVPVPFQGLFMRPAGDMRKDAIVKRELFDQHVREVYDVTLVLDDRLQVIRMWRELGLTVLDVAGGEF